MREEVRPPGRQGARSRRQFVRTLVAARLAADVCGRADDPRRAHRRRQRAAADERHRPARPALPDRRAHARGVLPDARRPRVRDRARPGLRALRRPRSGARRRRRTSRKRGLRRGDHAEFPGKLLAYNCSPSFNWKKNLDDATIAKFQRELGAMGYKFQFVTLAGFHALNHSMFELARAYRERGHDAATSSCRRPSSPRRRTATPPRATSARSGPATSTRWRMGVVAGGNAAALGVGGPPGRPLPARGGA